MPKYWVLGAMWREQEGAGPYEDQLPSFLIRGQWLLGWPEGTKPVYDELLAKVEAGDRVAIKSMDGKGADTVSIKALGIVRDVDDGGRTLYVEWLLKDLVRHVPAHGCFGTVHGPFEESDRWTNEVFHI